MNRPDVLAGFKTPLLSQEGRRAKRGGVVPRLSWEIWNLSRLRRSNQLLKTPGYALIVSHNSLAEHWWQSLGQGLKDWATRAKRIPRLAKAGNTLRSRPSPPSRHPVFSG